MKAHTILLLGLGILAFGTSDTSAQSVKERFKKATEKVRQGVKKEVSKITSGDTSGSSSGAKSSSGKSKGGAQAKGSGSTVNIPDGHTAFLAPIGDPENAKHGTKSVKPVKPPKAESKQPDWNDARTSVYELDNKSLVDEWAMLDELIDSRYLDPNSPASFRFRSVWDELEARRKAMERMVELYNECQSNYADGDAGWIDQGNRALAGQLKTAPYKRLIRSSIAPLFKDVNGKGCFSNDEAKEYFDAHGGVENAHKGKFTVWNPDAK